MEGESPVNGGFSLIASRCSIPPVSSLQKPATSGGCYRAGVVHTVREPPLCALQKSGYQPDASGRVSWTAEPTFRFEKPSEQSGQGYPCPAGYIVLYYSPLFLRTSDWNFGATDMDSGRSTICIMYCLRYIIVV